ncbi:hypothetical protein Fcan01_01079 [Folsomia candida]|uniref:Uncharacterized protein n=1 Tax=Folsomia candida TaxID=158441 RepID=A0A226EVX1_FOLCA|nr:hypothetical protein Fcan01_01079 [Folsomia candida]
MSAGGGGVSVGDDASVVGGGLCVFGCATILSGFGALAALVGFDLGPESAFFAINGLGAICFAKCQYLRLGLQRLGLISSRRDDVVRRDEIENREDPEQDLFNRKRKWWWVSQNVTMSALLPKTRKKVHLQNKKKWWKDKLGFPGVSWVS